MALIPPFHMDTVVALGTYDEANQLYWMASGFLYGQYSRTGENGDKYYHVYLVTAQHVLSGKRRLCLRFNPLEDKPARSYDIDLLGADDSPRWFMSPRPDADVAAIWINANLLDQEGIRFKYFKDDENVATVDTMKELGVSEGDYVFVLGFPMGIVGEKQNVVIARSGSIARIRDTLSGASSDYWVDAFVFPGNSGGPVVFKPELVSIEGTSAIKKAYLIGVVVKYIPYRDVAVSQQTGQVRVVFEENSGLARVLPIDFVQEAIQEHRRTLGPQGGPIAAMGEAEAPAEG